MGKRMGVKHTVLSYGRPPTVAFTVLAQLCGSKANETEMDSTLFTKNSNKTTLNWTMPCQFKEKDHNNICNGVLEIIFSGYFH